MPTVFRCATLALIAALTGCSSLLPEGAPGPVQMLVLSYDSTSSKYRLNVREVTTLTSLRTMEGDAAQIMGGAKIVVDYDEIAKAQPKSVEETQKLTHKDPGGVVDFAYFEVDGIIHPEDFHSLNIATTYYNFEKSHLYFAGVGAPLFNLPVLYFPDMQEGPADALEEQEDNAFWDPVAKFFAILPFEDVRELPMGMNLGVIAHEYSHAVFSNQVFPEAGVPWLYSKYFADPAKWSRSLNLNRSINEGLADFFGAAVSEDPAFIRKSLSMVGEARRLDPESPRCMTSEIEEAYETLPHAAYDPYPLGSVLAAALWESVPDTPASRVAFSKALVASMSVIRAVSREREDLVRLTDLLDAIAGAMGANLQPTLCGLLVDRFDLPEGSLRSCAELVLPVRKCR